MGIVRIYWYTLSTSLIAGYSVWASVPLQPAAIEQEAPIPAAPAVQTSSVPAPKQPQQRGFPSKNPPAKPQKPSEPTDERVSIFNATPVTISIRYERIGNPGIIEPIKPNSMITIMRKPATPMIYSLEAGGQTAPITPDMIVHGQVTIKVPPELMQSLTGATSTQPEPTSTKNAPSTGTTQPPAPSTGGSTGIIPQTPASGK